MAEVTLAIVKKADLIVDDEKISSMKEGDGGDYRALLDCRAEKDVTVKIEVNVDGITKYKTIIIKEGETVAYSAFAESNDDYYVDTNAITAKIISATTGDIFHQTPVDFVDREVSVNVTDDIKSVEVGIIAVATDEDQENISFKVLMSKPPRKETVVTVNIGDQHYDVTFDPATQEEIELANPIYKILTVTSPLQNSDVYRDEQHVEATIVGLKNGSVTAESSAVGKVEGEYEKLEVNEAYKKATVTILDTEDETRVSLRSSGDITEAGGDITYTATLTHASQGETVVTLDNGESISIADGETVGSVIKTISEEDDVYLDQRVIKNHITAANGGNFELLTVDDTEVETTVRDTIDETKVSLSSSGDITEAGGDIIYTATLTDASQGETTVTTTLGTITIANGATEGTMTKTIAPEEDVHNNERTITNEITAASGGNFENLTIDETKKSVSNKVKDTPTDTTLILSTSDVTEDDAGVTFTATLSHESDGVTTVETTLGTITIANGEKTGTLFQATKDSDVYIDASTLSNAITSASGGNFEHLVVNRETVTAAIADTLDVTTVSLNATTEETHGIFSVTLDNPVKKDTLVTLNQNDADGNPITIMIAQNQSTAQAEVVMDEGEYHVAVTSMNHVGSEADDLEAVDYTAAVADIKVVENSCPLITANDCTFIDQGASKTINVLDNDSGRGLTIISVDGVDHGEYEIVNNATAICYTAEGDTVDGMDIDNDTGIIEPTKQPPFLGTERFTYTAKDANGNTSTATVAVHMVSVVERRDKVYGNDGDDFFITGKGNDYMSGGAGDDKYFFSNGDGHDTILDTSGEDDKIVFTRDMEGKRESLSFLLESDGDLVMSYGDKGSAVTIKHQEQLKSIEKIEMYRGSYINEHAMDIIIQTLHTYDGSDSLSISEINEINRDTSLDQIVWNG